MYAAPAEYDALALVVSVIAEDASAWHEVYGTRAHDYRMTTAALQAFDEANPQPLDLGLNIQCGLCERRMSFHEGDPDSRLPAAYSCNHKHDDGRYHRVSSEDVDDAIDRHLRSRLRGRRHWVLAPELAPEPELVAAYADHLNAKIKTYDDHIGAAKLDRFLARERARLTKQLEQVRGVQEHGVFVVADLNTFADDYWRSTSAPDRATELGRALLVESVVCYRSSIRVVTRFDDHTALYRRLRTEELRHEIATARAHLSELEEELHELTDPVA
ncbi:zinc ribbon domain-containing protein [Streptosporangium sp. NBC_01810]|uniref:zinc ribbon domain-containing protein n=2 Tax=unclassified Streptosporangium TaxID=2632669 RepID=UPI002DD7CB82|nr:zinc ribbon domain-containing protein [Streptosporangium sp. NBC_01810]WSA26201.1 zinc ribbon domain-containing protein [Streptosporangium sp. NBC_01810]